MNRAYYNENDPKCVEWLKALIREGLIADGDVDDRSIMEVKAGDLLGYTQCHFFAGIGGWSLALRLAGWPDDRPVWTGSCPCQPFSVAGKRKGTDDERHLWPVWRRLIGAYNERAYNERADEGIAVCFGEQVASKSGRAWLAGVRAEMEALGYAVGAADLCAASVGAPHIRQRLWWVADAELQRTRQGNGQVAPQERGRDRFTVNGTVGGMGNNNNKGPQGRGSGQLQERAGELAAGAAGASGFWSDFDLIPCADGKSRRIESGTWPLAHGIPGRVAQLRGLGNAIVPQVAADFIKAYCEATGEADACGRARSTSVKKDCKK